MKNNNRYNMLISLVLLILMAGHAAASQPHDWQIYFQEAATPVAEHVHDLHHIVLVIITFVALFVLFLTGYIAFRFRASKNPTPSKRSHHTLLEIVWTTIPVLILLVIALPSFKLIFEMDKAKDPEMTLKITGNMWFWKYEYPEHDITFESRLIQDKDLKPGQLRLLEVDNQIVVPVDTTIRLLFTASDVLHSWTIPSFGVKKDCVPGRLNEAWIHVTKPGVYYGQCSELCGMQHGFMPIAVKVVSKEEYANWLKEAKTKYSS